MAEDRDVAEDEATEAGVTDAADGAAKVSSWMEPIADDVNKDLVEASANDAVVLVV